MTTAFNIYENIFVHSVRQQTNDKKCQNIKLLVAFPSTDVYTPLLLRVSLQCPGQYGFYL